jgi:hypothetical protein
MKSKNNPIAKFMNLFNKPKRIMNKKKQQEKKRIKIKNEEIRNFK